MRVKLSAVAFCLIAVPLFSQPPLSKQQQIASHARQAQEYLAKNQPALAAKEFAAIIELNPNDVEARGNLGVLLFFQPDYAKAVPHLSAAVKLRPGLWKLQALLGMAEKRTGRGSEAQADLEKAFPQLQEEKLRVEAGLELIELYYGAGNLDKAAEIAGVLKQLRPSDPDVLYAAHRVYSDLAGETMLGVAMTAPKSARMHQMMAHELARQGLTEGAILHYREALKLAPTLPGLHFELAEVLNRSSAPADQDEVEKEYQAALAENPSDGKTEVRLGDVALRKTDLPTAFSHYKRAIELLPSDADAQLGMAKTLTSMHQSKEAEPYLKRARELEPFNAVTHYRLSLVYRELGRAGEAQKELAEFQRLKEMKDRLKQIYEEMRLQPMKQDQPDRE